MSETLLYVLQRFSAKLLAPLVLAHLVLVLYAVNGGLSAAEILARTEGSVAWGVFYGVFVVAVSVHAPIGLRNVLLDLTPWRGASLNAVVVLVGVALALLGFRAVVAVV